MFIITFIRPVWAGLLAVSAGLVPGPVLCSGAGAAERPQEILYRYFMKFGGKLGNFSSFQIFILFEKIL